MRGIDGQPMPKEYYELRGIEEAITGGTTLSFRPKPSTTPSHFQVQGAAAALLAADLAGPKQREDAIKTVIAAAARPFIELLQTEDGRQDLLLSKAFAPSRFDTSAWLKYASSKAWAFGAVRWSTAKAQGIMAAQLVIAAERARIALGAEYPMHPAFANVCGISSVADWPALLREAADVLVRLLGTTMIAPTKDGSGINICYWSEGYSTPRHLVFWSPRLSADSIVAENDSDRGFRGLSLRTEYQVHGDEMTAKLKRSTYASTQDFIDAVLPIEYQALLAYEGLYFAVTGNPRTANATVRYASHAEGAYAQDWSTLLNYLIAKLPGNKRLLPVLP